MLFCRLRKVEKCQCHIGSIQWPLCFQCYCADEIKARYKIVYPSVHWDKWALKCPLTNKCPLKGSGDDDEDSGYLTPNIGHRLRPRSGHLTNAGLG